MKTKKKKITMEDLAGMIITEAKKTKEDLAEMIGVGDKETRKFMRREIDGLTKKVVAGDRKTRSFMRAEIANLARMTQDGFAEAVKNNNEHFDKLEEKIDKLEKGSIASHERRIKRVEELLVIK